MLLAAPSTLRVSRTLTRSTLFGRTRLPIFHTLYSTKTHPFRAGIGSHVAAGMCGGLLVIAGAYSWYHFSGLKRTVDAVKDLRVYIELFGQFLAHRNNASGNASSNIPLAYLRQAAKSYVAGIPGAGFLIDSAFDSVDETFEAHQEEASIITQRVFDEIQVILRKKDEQTIDKVIEVLRKYLIDLHELGMKAGGTVVNPTLEKYPAAKEKLDAAFDELKSLVEQGGANSKRIFDDAQQQVTNILSTNVSSDVLSRAKDFILQKAHGQRTEAASTDPDEREPTVTLTDKSV